jgi:hypothetical protein
MLFVVATDNLQTHIHLVLFFKNPCALFLPGSRCTFLQGNNLATYGTRTLVGLPGSLMACRMHASHRNQLDTALTSSDNQEASPSFRVMSKSDPGHENVSLVGMCHR